jgi:hypothetical protein
MSFTNSGAAASDDVVSLPPEVITTNPTDTIVGAAVSADRTQLYVVTQNAEVFTVDLNAGTLIGVGRLGLRPNEYVSWGAFALSDDGNVAYVGTGPSGNNFDDFIVKDIHELTIGSWIETHQTPTPGGLARAFAPTGNGHVILLDASNDEAVVIDVRHGVSDRAFKARGVGRPLAIITQSYP